MKLIKKELLALAMPPPPKEWPAVIKSKKAREAYRDYKLAAVAALKRYGGGMLLCLTFYDRKGKPYVRTFVGKQSYTSYLCREQRWSHARLSKLTLPDDPYSYNGLVATRHVYVSAEASRVIERFRPKEYKWCGDKLNRVDYIISGMNSTRRYGTVWKRRDAAAEVPTNQLEQAPPADLIDWLTAQGAFGEQYMITRPHKYRDPLTGLARKELRGWCTACHGDVWLDGFIHSPHPDTVVEPAHGNTIYCPDCGELVECRTWARTKSPIESRYRVLVFSKVDDKVVAMGYEAGRVIGRDQVDRTYITAMDMYVFGYEFSMRFAKWCQGNFGQKYMLNDWDFREELIDSWWDHIYPVAPETFAGTVLENSHVWDYLEANGMRTGPKPMKYLDQYLRYPGIENLLRHGFVDLIDEKLSGNSTINKAVKWREASPRKMLGLNKGELARARSEGWDSAWLLEYKKQRDAGWTMDREDLGVWMTIRHSYHDLEVPPGTTGRQVVRYLQKQFRRCKDSYSQLVITYRDYLQEAAGLGYDFTSEVVVFPGDLQAAHDRTVGARKYAEQEALRQQFRDTYEQLAPLAWEHEGLMIRPAMDEVELIHEGKVLEHCVAGYGKSHCGGNPIFFIRRSAQPDAPYYTLQLHLEARRIIQNRGFRNNGLGAPQKPPEIDQFAELWLQEVVKQYDFEKKRFKRRKKKAAA